MDKLASYKLNKAFTEGVDICLDDAPEVQFRVRLPSQYNRGYTNAIYGGMGFKVSADGMMQTEANIMDAKYAQEDAFLAHCLVSMDGEPVPADFAAEYPAALAEPPARRSLVAWLAAAVTAGVRPEKWRVDAEGPLTLAVDVIEPTGAETHVYGHIEGHAVRCVFRERLNVAPGDTLRLSVNPASLHAFDPQSGRRVSA